MSSVDLWYPAAVVSCRSARRCRARRLGDLLDVGGEEVHRLLGALDLDVAADALRFGHGARLPDEAGVAADDADRLACLDDLRQGALGRLDPVEVLDVQRQRGELS